MIGGSQMKSACKKPRPLSDRHWQALKFLVLKLRASAWEIGASCDPGSDPDSRATVWSGVMSRLVNRGFVERQFDPALNYNFYTISAAGRSALRGDPQ
jgi:hypothetical protein